MRRNRSTQPTYAVLIGLLFSLFLRSAFSQETVEFDPIFLRGNGQRGLDVSRFNRDNPVPAGEYESDIFVNNTWKGRASLRFVEHGSSGASMLCLTDRLLRILDLEPDAVNTGKMGDGRTACVMATHAVPNATFKYRYDELRLDVSIPQAYLRLRPRGYISPDSWQSGVSSAFLNYDYDYYQSTATGFEKRHRSHFLSLHGGVNLGNWHYRHHGTMNWGSATRNGDPRGSRYQSYSNYLQRDIPALRSQFMAGDFTSSGSLFETMSLRGIQVLSDDRMLPDSMRGFAPTVRGVAQSNARVTITQNSHVIYETTVPPGPFEIADLYSSSYGGDLHVTVNEADGTARSFIVPFNTQAQLLRPGNVKYQIAAGRFRFGSTTLNEHVWQASLQYGVSNWLTVNAGVSGAERFRAALLGGVFNTRLGAFGVDLTSARSTVGKNVKQSGLTWRFGYTHYLPQTKTHFSLSATRYPAKGFYSVQDAILHENRDILARESLYLLDRQKSQVQLSLNQSFAQGWGTAYISAYTNNYWHRHGRNTTLQAGYSNSYKNINYTLSVSRTRDYYTGRNANNIFLSMSIPLGKNSQHHLTTQVGSRTLGGTYAASTLWGTFGADNEYSYGLSANHDASGTSGSVNGSYRSPYNLLNASAGTGNGYRQLGASVTGAIVAHPRGISFSEQVDDTFAIISAPGAEGAKVTSGTNARLGADGIAIVPHLNPYTFNTVGIDPQQATQDVDFEATSQQVIPRANSAMLIELKTRKGAGVLFQLTFADGSFPPLGSEVQDENGNAQGFVAQRGYVYVRGPKPTGSLTIRWGAAESERCSAPYSLDAGKLASRQPRADFVKVKIQCQ